MLKYSESWGISKKKIEVMTPALEELTRRLYENNYSETVVNNVIAQIEPFVGYGFPKPLLIVILDR